MKPLKFIIFLFLTGAFISGFSQTRNTLDSLRKIEQSCLDRGVHMPSCSYEFLHQMDSLLNVVYTKYYSTLGNDQKASLKKDQLNWLKKRDAFFKQADKEYSANRKSGEWGPDMRMVTYQDKSSFIYKRVLELINRLNARVK